MKKVVRSERFRVNPVELIVFCIVTLIFVSSVYNLFYDVEGFQPRPLLTSIGAKEESRKPASISNKTTFASLELDCTKTLERKTNAAKVRLRGPICDTNTGDKQIVQTQIVNSANQSEAAVFTNPAEKTYLTDFIPLSEGKNPIDIQFVFQGGQTVHQKLSVMRN